MSDSHVITESTITCPVCGASKAEPMPTDACQYFYTCTGCGTLLRPKPSDCCVFCSYGSVPCPPVQQADGGSPCCQSEVSRLTAEIRPGVHRPNWSLVTRSAARDALLARGRARPGLTNRWIDPLSREEDHVWRTVLELFVDYGRAPRLPEVASKIGLPLESVRLLVSELAAHDLLGMDQAAGAIMFAYPFTEQATAHRVELRGRTMNALCAIDALGVGSMYRTDVTVTSSCRGCGTQVQIGAARSGRAVQRAQPPEVVVWYDLGYAQCAATPNCPAIGFFCCDDHLQRWLTAQLPTRAGYRLGLEEALEVGSAHFEPILTPPACVRSPSIYDRSAHPWSAD